MNRHHYRTLQRVTHLLNEVRYQLENVSEAQKRHARSIPDDAQCDTRRRALALATDIETINGALEVCDTSLDNLVRSIGDLT